MAVPLTNPELHEAALTRLKSTISCLYDGTQLGSKLSWDFSSRNSSIVVHLSINGAAPREYVFGKEYVYRSSDAQLCRDISQILCGAWVSFAQSKQAEDTTSAIIGRLFDANRDKLMSCTILRHDVNSQVATVSLRAWDGGFTSIDVNMDEPGIYAVFAGLLLRLRLRIPNGAE